MLFPPVSAGGVLRTPFRKQFSQWNFQIKKCTIDRVRQTMIICEKEVEKSLVYCFKMVAILLIFLVIAQYHENWKKPFYEDEFQRNLAQSSRLLFIKKTHNWKKMMKFVFPVRFYRQNGILPRVKIC